MTRVRVVAYLILQFLLAFHSGLACCQGFPSKPLRIFTSPPGGGNDFASRLIAQAISPALGQPVVVENRSGVVPAQSVAKAAPDGYSILLTAGNLWVTPLLQKTLYDPVADFFAITWATNSPNILVVHPSLPAKSVRELISLARSNPGQLNYAAAGIGSSPHLAAELFKAMAKVSILYVPYKGAGTATTDLIAGHVQLMFATATSVTPHVRSGRLRALAVTSSSPSATIPELPTIAMAGLPGYEYDMGGATTIFAPAKTPSEIVNRLNQEIVKVLNRPETKEKFFVAGMEIIGSTPEQLEAILKKDMAKWKKVIEGAGIRGE